MKKGPSKKTKGARKGAGTARACAGCRNDCKQDATLTVVSCAKRVALA